MIKQFNWKQLTVEQQQALLQRPTQTMHLELAKATQEIIETVRLNGDQALYQLTKRLDNVSLNTIQVPDEALQNAAELLSEESKFAIQQAVNNLQIFHALQLPSDIQVTTQPGVFCEKQMRALDSVGFYVPGGSAPLVSTVLMLAVPANIAGCSRKILCTPPRREGGIDPHILYAAYYCGIDAVYQVGGAQAIAAMAYGTQTIPKVTKIFGPGNAWVTQAKLIVGQDPKGACCDLPAGPSEILIIGDEMANPDFIAADLLSQAEHGVDSQAILLTPSSNLIVAVANELAKQLPALPRHAIARKALENSYLLQVEDLSQAIMIANQYAPEHLILNVVRSRTYVPQIKAAGSVFLGPWSPEAVGDYASGTNHVLPTYGYARALSGLGVADFMTQISFQELSYLGLKNLSTTVMTLAKIEGLMAHYQAVAIRLQQGVLKNE